MFQYGVRVTVPLHKRLRAYTTDDVELDHRLGLQVWLDVR
jgi:hypothetical protein